MADTLLTTPGRDLPQTTERNLLFGVLALQMDLLDLARLADACSLWITCKGRSLAEMLVERGWLSPTDKGDVERHLERKWRRHGGDGRASLAGVVNPEIRQVLAALHDPDVDACLGGSIPSEDLQSVLLPTTLGLPADRTTSNHDPAPQAPSDHKRERFTLLRLHAAGGIGRVWLAQDAVMGRDVALKELRPEQSGHRETLARFLTEARITGQLEHPGIVPVYELSGLPGTEAPFYTMRFIKGQTLSAVVHAYHEKRAAGQATPLEQRALLDAFVTVCNTLAYAHDRGVIHRDLKGANVVVGDFGEVVVLDWGLAKILGRPEEGTTGTTINLAEAGEVDRTLPGQVFGTPAFMPPEQAEGRHDLIDARSDVYGLGAILYEILTGQAPYTGANASEILAKVLHQAPEPPSRVCAGVPPALEAVCLRALARSPGDRYASAADLAQEVQCWLADEPVRAYREPWLARLWRRARRHRLVVTSVAALLLTALVALSISTILIGREQVRTEKARGQAEEQKQRAEMETEKTEVARSQAETARQQASQSFRQAREVVNRFPLQMSKEYLLNEPGLQVLRQDLARQARQAFERFVADQGDHPEPEVLADLARALMLEADLTSEINPNQAEAIDLINRASALFEQLARIQPANPAYQRDWARSFNKRGMYYHVASDRTRAEAAYKQSLALFQAALERAPDDRATGNGLCICLNNLSQFCVSDPKLRPQAETHLERSQKVCEGLLQADPDNVDYQRCLADTRAIRGELNSRTKRFDPARVDLEESLKIRDALVARHPEVIEYQNDQGKALANLGRLYAQTERRDEAVRYYKKALAIRLEVSKRNPAVTQFQRLVVSACWSLGYYYYQEIGKASDQAARDEAFQSGREWFEKALEIDKELVRQHPGVLLFQDDLGQVYAMLGNLHYDAQRDTFSYYDQAIATLAHLPEGGVSADGKLALAESYWGRAQSFRRSGAHSRALADWKLALRLYRGQDTQGLWSDAQAHMESLRSNPLRPLVVASGAGMLAYPVTPGPLLAGSLLLPEWAGGPLLSDALPYDLACAYSLLARSVFREERLPLLTRMLRVADLSARALEMLERARAAHLFEDPAWRERLEQDADLKELRSLPQFSRLVRP
jgi:serine/threonine protein kinase/tetratricopeptide (TPR) repeat protein